MTIFLTIRLTTYLTNCLIIYLITYLIIYQTGYLKMYLAINYNLCDYLLDDLFKNLSPNLPDNFAENKAWNYNKSLDLKQAYILQRWYIFHSDDEALIFQWNWKKNFKNGKLVRNRHSSHGKQVCLAKHYSDQPAKNK